MIKVTAVGRLTRDAEVFSYGQGKTGISFTLACNIQGYEEPIFIQCTQFGRDENLAQYLLMGNQLIVVGDLTRNQGQDGNWYDKIIVQELEFGAKKM